jgi:hypothetical protein
VLPLRIIGVFKLGYVLFIACFLLYALLSQIIKIHPAPASHQVPHQTLIYLDYDVFIISIYHFNYQSLPNSCMIQDFELLILNTILTEFLETLLRIVSRIFPSKTRLL